MEQSESVLEAIFEEETLEEDLQDAEMLDAETLDGDLSDQFRVDESTKDGGIVDDDNKTRKHESRSRNWRRRNAKKKKKNNKSGSASNITDINRFVVDTCRRLKEKKSYLVWNAVGVLGASTVSDLVKEVGISGPSLLVMDGLHNIGQSRIMKFSGLCLRCSQPVSNMVDAIQDCGGQLTADGKRYRTSGGILWNILKTREPKAYKEIMARGREFEKQFRQQNMKQTLKENREATSRKTAHVSDGVAGQVPENSQLTLEAENEPAQSDSHGGRVSVLSRIRVPVTYDDLFAENAKDGLT